ncbi:MAG: DUF3332 family protein [Bacteriovoracia bacterium]
MKRYLRTIAVILLLTIQPIAFQGCAAGNWNLIRKVANWNLKMSILPRVLVYIILVIIPVYAVTALLDAVIFNTIEFWTGSAVIRADHKVFEKDGDKVEIVNTVDPLKKSKITTTHKDGSIQVVEMIETPRGTIEIFMDGKKVKEIEKEVLAAS